MPKRIRSVGLTLSVAGTLLVAGSPPALAAARPGALGRQLVHRFFRDTQKHKITDLKRFLAPAFQIQRADGTRQNKAQFIAKLPDVKSFQLRNFRVTSTARTIIVTYQAAANEIIDGKPYLTGFEPRITVFARGPKGWQIIAHSNFNKPQ